MIKTTERGDKAKAEICSENSSAQRVQLFINNLVKSKKIRTAAEQGIRQY